MQTKNVARFFKIACFLHALHIKCSRSCKVQALIKSDHKTANFKNTPDVIKNTAKFNSKVQIPSAQFYYDANQGIYLKKQIKIQIKFIHQGTSINLGQIVVNLSDLLNAKKYEYSGTYPVQKCYDNTANIEIDFQLEVFDQNSYHINTEIERVYQEMNKNLKNTKVTNSLIFKPLETIKQNLKQSFAFDKPIINDDKRQTEILTKGNTKKQEKIQSNQRIQKCQSIMKQSVQIAKITNPDQKQIIREIKQQVQSMKNSVNISVSLAKDAQIKLLTQKLLDARKSNNYLKIANRRILQFQEQVGQKKNLYAMELQSRNEQILRLMKELRKFKDVQSKGVNTDEITVQNKQFKINANIEKLIKQNKEYEINIKESNLLVQHLKAQLNQKQINSKKPIQKQSEQSGMIVTQNKKLKDQIVLLKKKIQSNMKSQQQTEIKSIQIIQKLKKRAVDMERNYQKKIKQIEDEKCTLIASINKIKEDNIKLRTQNFQIKLIFDSNKKQFQTMKQKFNEAKNKQKKQKKKSNQDQLTLKKNNKIIQILKSQNFELKNEIQQFKLQIKFINQSNKQLTRQANQFQQRMYFTYQRQHITMKEHQEQIQLKSIKIQWLNQKSKNLQAEIQRMKTKIKSLQQQNNAFSNSISDKQDEIKNLKQQIENLNDENQRLANQIELIQEQNSNLNNYIENSYIPTQNMRKKQYNDEDSIQGYQNIKANNEKNDENKRKTIKKIQIDDLEKNKRLKSHSQMDQNIKSQRFGREIKDIINLQNKVNKLAQFNSLNNLNSRSKSSLNRIIQTQR